jgi:hypothetical protein
MLYPIASVPLTFLTQPIQHPAPIYVTVPRGGDATTVDLLGDASLESLGDDDIDQMVEDLIASVESDDEVDDASDDEDLNGTDVSDPEEEGSAQEVDDETADDHVEILSAGKVADEATESADSSTEDECIGNLAASNDLQDTPASKSTMPTSTFIKRPSTNTIPTNAYYRFMVRRGPKGHILASFSLLSIQWIHTYLPFLYNIVASILLTLRIYDPKLLHVRERERILKEQRRRERTSFTEKLKGTFSNSNKKVQKEADQRATSKLQQLYKTAVATSLDWKEVRYSYLSVGFRKRHELGGDYVKKKPLRFMGEEVGGGLVVNGESDEVVLDDNELHDELSEEPITTSKEGNHAKLKKQHRRKRKITDWVVQSFANQHYSESNNTPSIEPLPTGSKQSQTGAPSLTSIWKSVQHDAILNAAWESRNAEKSIWTNNERNVIHSTKQHTLETETPNSSGSASKMFQSVMTRVGSNGRLLGAYPMDAMPIEECSNRRGVIKLARRYGYGDWSADVTDDWDESEELSDDSWGGGDLIFEDDIHNVRSDTKEIPENTRSHRHKSRKKKKVQLELNEAVEPTKSRRRSKKKKSKQT